MEKSCDDRIEREVIRGGGGKSGDLGTDREREREREIWIER